MKALIQIVDKCTLTIENNPLPYSAINKGMLILLGVENGDKKDDSEKLAKKIASLRIFDDKDGKMNLSCIDPYISGKFMVVSQFTLCADCSHGRRPNMISAARPEIAKPLYEYFVECLNNECKTLTQSDEKFVVIGSFGAHMLINFTNVGPVTMMIESEDLK